MTMDHELENGCKNCSVLRNEIDKRTAQWESSNAQQLAGFLTLKQKIIGTDKLIREYQSSKVECDILTRKNEEFVHLIDQLHRDLSTRNQEYAQIYGSIELLKKVNADYEVKFKELNDEAQKWKSQAEAGENFTSQLVEKVKILEKYEEEVKHTASVTRECEKMESKVKAMKVQLKEAKETTNKSKKEICKLQREYNLLVKYAKQWGKVIEKQGKFNVYQHKFYSKLCKDDEKNCDDSDQDVIDANETDEQSKLLEQLLGEGDGSDSMMGAPDILSSDTEVWKDNSLSLSKGRLQSPDKSLPSKQVKQTRSRAQRRGNQDNATPSELTDKTPTCSPMTRKRTRTASQNSVTLSSDADTATELEKDNNKRSGPRTRSRAVKITAIPALKGPEPITISDLSNVIAKQALPEFITDIPCKPTQAMDNILELEPMAVKPLITYNLNKKEHNGSLSSLESECELKLPTKSSGDVAIPTPSISSSISGVIPLTNIFEIDGYNDSPKQQNRETGSNQMDQNCVQPNSQLRTTVDNSSLLEFGFDSSSDSDMEMIPVPNCKLQTSSSQQDQTLLTDLSTSLKTTFSGIFDNPRLKSLSEEELPIHDPASKIDNSCSNINRVPCSISALEADLDMTSSESEADVIKHNQETTPKFSNTDVAVQESSFSLDDDHSLGVTESAIIRDIGAVPNVGVIQQIDGEVPVIEANSGFAPLLVDEKTVGESSRNNAFEKQEETSKHVDKSVFVENEREIQDVSIVSVSEIIQMGPINNLVAVSKTPTQIPKSLDLQPKVVEDQSETIFQEDSNGLPERLQVIQPKLIDLWADDVSSLETKEQKELEKIKDPLLILAEDKSEKKLESEATVIPEQLPDNVQLEPVDTSINISLQVDTLSMESEMPKQLEENDDPQPILIKNKCEKILQKEAVVVFSDKKQENLQIEPVDTEMLKSLNSHEMETMVIEDENEEKEFQNVPVVSPENLPIHFVSELVDPVSADAFLVETARQEQFEDQDLFPRIMVVEDKNAKEFQNEAVLVVTEKLQGGLDNSQVNTRIADQLEEILEAEPIVVEYNVSKAPSVSLEKITGYINSSSDPAEAEMPEPSEGNKKFESSENHPEESQLELADKSLILESDNKPKMVDHQHETEQMAVDERTKKYVSLKVAKTSSKREKESKSDDVDELSGTKSPVEIPVTKSTEGNQTDDLMMESIIEKSFPCNELVAASSEKFDQIQTEYVDTFPSNTSPVEVGVLKSMENPDSETVGVGEKPEKESSSVETEKPNSMRDSATGFDELTEKDLHDEEIIVLLDNPQEDQVANFQELSNTNFQIETGMPKPMENDQEIYAIVSDKSEKEFSDKSQEDQLEIADIGIQFSTKNLLVETGSAKSKDDNQGFGEETVGDKYFEKLLDGNVSVPVKIMQDESTLNVAGSLLQVETEVPMPIKDKHKSPTAVNDKPEIELIDKVEDFLNTPTQSQQFIVRSGVETSSEYFMDGTGGSKKNNPDFGAAENDGKELFNSEFVDPIETLQEESQSNISEPSGKYSPSEVETEVLKSTENLEIDFVKSGNNKPPIEVEMAANTEPENESIPVNRIPGSESSTEVDVQPGTISDLGTIEELPNMPTIQETVSQASPHIVRQAMPNKILESSPIPSEENRNIGHSLQLDATNLILGQPTFPLTDVVPVAIDAHRSLFNPPVFIERNSKLDSSKLSKVLQTSEVPTAFKVPKVPDVNLQSNFPWSKSIPHGVKRSTVDDEVAVILKQIRTNIIELPTTISPLPKSPEPRPIVPIKIEEPKSRFPVLPRCAFNWTGKKLPISDQLTERFGGYLHPGVQVRVRFRRVSRRLRDIRSPDTLSHCFQGVTNFAEAERRTKPILRFVPIVEDIEDVVESEMITEPDRISRVSAKELNKLPEKRPPHPDNLFCNQIDVNIDDSKKNRRSTSKAKVTTPVSRSKAVAPDLFGSDSSSSESERESNSVQHSNDERLLRPSSFVPSPIQERLTRPSTFRNLKEKQPETDTSYHSSRVQSLGQLIEPIIPLGRGDSFTRAKQNGVLRDPESPTTDQTRRGLGLGREIKTSKHLISPCSESLLSVVSKAKTPVNRVIAPLRRTFKQPEVPTAPVVTTPILSDSSLPLNETQFRKRVSHTFKRGLEPEPAVPSVSPASKRGRTLPEKSPPALRSSSPVSDKVESEVPISARTRQKSKTFCPVKPQETAKLGAKNVPPRKKTSRQKTIEKSSNISIERLKRLVTENSTSGSEIESMEVNTDEAGRFSSSERGEKIFKPNEADSDDSSNEKGRSPLQLPNSPRSSDVEESSHPPKMDGSPRSHEVDENLKSPNADESPKSPDVDESPKSPNIDESPQSPDEKTLDTHSNSKTAVEIPISSPTQSEQHLPSAFELVYKDLQEAFPVQPRHKLAKGTARLKKEIHSVVFKFFKDSEVSNELLNSLVERVMRSDSLNTTSIFIRTLISTVIRGWNDPIDVSNTPPAPPMAAVHQRCVIVLQKLDETNSKMQITPNVNQNMFSDLFLGESSAIMFQTDSSLTLEEMCSLSRAYTAVCRSRGSLAKARAFLFDCVYFMPPKSYALAYTIMSVWADVLRQVSFPLGVSCVDQTIAYVLLHNCKVKAVQGISGKVVQTRLFLQNTYEYKKTTRTVDDLVDYLMTRFYETNSSDEASSLCWSLVLLARWEGVDFAIQVIEKKLWPFLQRWSSGEGTNNSAAAVIIAIGILGKTVPASKREGVKSVLVAMKALLQSEGVVPPIQEAAFEAVIHLGEADDPKSIFEIMKGWTIVSTNLSQHMRLVLKAFLKRHSNLCVV